MASVICLQYLPDEAESSDIRQFFQPLAIRRGGVVIMDDEYGNGYAYVTFYNSDDAQQAMQKNGHFICGQRVILSLCAIMLMPVENTSTQPNAEDDYTQAVSIDDLYNDAKYFLIKSNCEENIELAKREGVWSAFQSVENLLDRAFMEHENVILIFSVNQSGKFQGYARMARTSRSDNHGFPWKKSSRMSKETFSRVIKIDWINQNTLPFDETLHLINQLNENKPVQVGRDGQEVEPSCGKALCDLFPNDQSIDKIKIVINARNSKKNFSRRYQSGLSVQNTRPLTSNKRRRSPSHDEHHRSDMDRPVKNDCNSRHHNEDIHCRHLRTDAD